MCESHLCKRRLVFIWELKLLAHDVVHFVSCGLICAGWCEIIHLTKEACLFTVKHSCADGSVMSGSLEVQFRGFQDGVDVDFPQSARFWMSLQGSLDWQDMTLVNWF